MLLGCQLVLLDPGTVSTTESLDAGTDGDGTLVGLSDVESKLIDRAMAELVAEQNVLMDQITFVGIEAVEWPDASLGCPQDDMMSAQVITPGYRIVLETDSKTYQYHTGATEDSLLIRCEDE
ncbi:hypothetical protein KFU94_22040 [Chloroflexi bacterium TSY]|nr:hypothetical protein [Chloroflexi bacterium TSY]